MTADYTSLASNYDEYRIGYSTDLYGMLKDFGFALQGSVIDVGCGTGLASEPLYNADIEITGVDKNDAMLEFARTRFPRGTWVKADAEALPFEGATFDGAISAQAFQWFDRRRALAEMIRVTKSGSVIAIWWKLLMSDEPLKAMREQVCEQLGIKPPISGLSSGFVEFYGSPLLDHTLRVIPWRISVPIDRWLGYERSRANLQLALGGKIDAYIKNLEAAMHRRYGSGNASVSVGYLQYLYMAKKP